MSRSRRKKTRAPVPRSNLVPRRRITKQIYIKLTAAQKKANHFKAQQRRQNIRSDVAEWMVDIREKAEQLGDKYQLSTRYFLNMFFQNGLRLTKPQAVTNSFNAWKSEKALELKEGK
jgi:hypothetical protein